MAELDVERFYNRLKKLHSSFVKHKNFWNGAQSMCLNRGQLNDDEPYNRSVVLHHWLFGYELPDTIVLLKEDGNMYVCSTKKKCEFLQPAIGKDAAFKIHLLVRNKDDNNAENYATLLKQATQGSSAKENSYKVGVIAKERDSNKDGSNPNWILPSFERELDEAVESKSMELVDVTHGIALLMAAKDDFERDLMKKSSVLSNKVMKHGFVKTLEEVIEEDTKITNEALAQKIESILEDPNKIKLNVPPEDVQPCYFPIIQSGGKYDLKISAQSTNDTMTTDIITVSLGARYKLYCSNIARTFLVDPPKKVSETYEILLELQDACLEAMVPGQPLKSVYKAAVSYLQKNGHGDLVSKLPKNLGFAQGLDFRDSTLTLSPKNGVTLKKGMFFCLSIGFQDLELTSSDLSNTPDNSPVKKLKTYALLLSDMVVISEKGGEVLTKMGKAITDVAYNVNDGGDDDDDDDDDGDAKLARKLAKESAADGERRSKRLARDPSAAAEASEGVAERERRQIELMQRRNEERVREIARKNAKNRGKDSDEDMAEELEAYRSPKAYPPNVQPNQVKVDMANQCVILPVFGNPIPFHISTIKNVVLPDPDNATLLRINFYTAGIALGKDAPTNMLKLVQKYAPYASFIREMTFRSLDGNNLVAAFRQISELRKRARAKEIREQEEANLVQQEKLIRTKNERVPRLADLTMRPVFAGRKTQGNLEAHSNGLRFISTRSEVVDIMYANIKYAIFQPCENEIMVLVHFHLKNPIMVGKKKHIDIQFFTEVVDASQAVDNGRRSMYDPDEMDDEQRERQLRKKLNNAFKDFCKKVDAVAKKNNYQLEFDVPYRDLGFMGNPHKEMVQILPTLNCLVNLTETPFFVVDLDDVDHVHFERVTYMSKAFDMILINKDFNKMPWRIDMIPNGDKDSIQEWLTDMEISYTEGPMNLNWKSILNTAKEDDRFYMTTEDDEVTEKEAGWEILRMFGREDEEEEEEDEDDSEFGEESVGEEEELEEDDEEEDFDSEDDDESDFDADAELEEEGMDWDEMEEQAAEDDKRKRRMGDEYEEAPRKKRGGGNTRDSGGGRQKKQRRR
ncbi:Xaa-pro dipeptidase [Nitzschia inconspicua]|uniref:FACT complex subunit n=1 Tax=Nitzschia inconspicua TaxID=303405 RepID=A0A9K3L0T3_9STRA|nr:Xaa-pro dipeptidase [Nitzschia inconspicua]